MKTKILVSAFLLSMAWAAPAAADTSLELLQGWNYNNDFNGDNVRTTLTVKTFQYWPYGTYFVFYDVTGPFTPPDAEAGPNEKGGFFGSHSFTFSIKRIGQAIAGTEWDWGALADFSVRTEIEHVSKFGALFYYGLQWDLKIPHMDFVSTTANIRDDWSLSGVDLQLGGAWQTTIPLGSVTDLVFAGFFAWGVFGEGQGKFTIGPDDAGQYIDIPIEGRPFFITQPQLLIDVGKLTGVVDGKLYAGTEAQIALNRYLQKGVHENLFQLMFKWNI